MPLLSLWETNPSAIGEFSIDQVVAASGDGNLRDGSPCSTELTTYLSRIPSEKLSSYVQQCLTSKFDRAGMVLQDLVNEFGRRLDYQVTNGRYQGTSNAVGYDGLWRGPEGQTIVVEVKTTDAYRISLDTIAGYRRRLLEAGTVGGQPSILIVVGRQDTGELEAQVRGSRYAWDIRIISAEALIKLATLKENSDDPKTSTKIRGVITPVEYTRLDELVDVMFTTATDVEAVEVEAETSVSVPPTAAVPPTAGDESSGWQLTDANELRGKRELVVAALSTRLGASLIKRSRALYWSPDHTKRVACTISKRYTAPNAIPYWYAYHPSWDDFLSKDGPSEGYLVLGCMDLDIAFMIPREDIIAILQKLNKTENARGKYWHLHIVEPSPGRFELVVPKQPYLPLSKYILPLG